jgi:hypothetical protein
MKNDIEIRDFKPVSATEIIAELFNVAKNRNLSVIWSANNYSCNAYIRNLSFQKNSVLIRTDDPAGSKEFRQICREIMMN